MKECITHHFACECREEKFKDMERENKQLRQTVLETLNQRGQRELIVAWDRAKELERENAALRADKERLDWLLTNDGGFWVNWMYDKDEWTPELKASRDAIDACRNGRIGREKP